MHHLPVLYKEVLQGMNIQAQGLYLDATFGRGGHSRGILSCLDDVGRLLAFDRDLDAVNSEQAVALAADKRFAIRHCRFSFLEGELVKQGWFGRMDGILLDLGVSSPQLDNPARGFSFLRDGPLDMRMDENAGKPASEWLANVAEHELVQVLFRYGEERFAKRIARAIVRQRKISAINTTGQLAALVVNAVPVQEKNKHPATRTFQAIRIKVNRELEEIEAVLDQAVRGLKKGGRLMVISFHSLEDRLVKRFIRDEVRGQYRADKLPLAETAPAARRLRRIGGAVRATASEITQNPRSRSAILRIAERL